jgi:hypothetical protein
MVRAKWDLGGNVVIDEQPFVWRLDREPQWCTADGWQGIAIAVRHDEGQREAILQFPMPKHRSNGSPQLQRPQVNAAIVSNGIKAALSAGWDPFSRGKSIVFAVDANGC